MLRMRTFCVIAALWLLGVGSLHAQGSAKRVLVHYVKGQDAGDSLQLQIYLTPLDSNNNVVTAEDSLQEGTITLDHDLKSVQYPVTLQTNLQTPIYIAMALDLSGSMSGSVEIMKQSALSAVRNAPDNAQFILLFFNTVGNQINIRKTPFLSPSETEREIAGVAQVGGGTPLYDAAYQAVDELAKVVQTNEDVRQAVVLFTDGHDELNIGEAIQGQHLSQHSAQDVIAHALEKLVPIHTIGLGGGNEVDGSLGEIAKRTGGRHLLGSEVDLQKTFEEIMRGLNSQWLVISHVYARKGQNIGQLSLKTLGGLTLETLEEAQIEFQSDRDYMVPADAPVITLSSIIPPKEKDGQYILSLQTAGGSQAAQWRLEILQEGTTMIGYPKIYPMTETKLAFSAESLRPGEGYDLRLLAVDENGTPIPNQDGETILLETQFKHLDADEVQEPLIEVDHIEIDRQNWVMRVTLDVTNATMLKAGSYKLEMFSEETNALINRTPNKISDFVYEYPLTDLPAATYHFRAKAERIAGGVLESEETEEDTIDYRPIPPSAWSRIIDTFRRYWYIFLLLLLLFLFGGLFLWWKNRNQSGLMMTKNKKQQRKAAIRETNLGEEPPPYVSQYNTPPPPLVPRQKNPPPYIVVEKCPDAAWIGREIVLDHFPFVIGREEGDVVLSDRQLSRRHAQFTEQNGVIYLVDLGSTNNSFVDRQPLTPNRPSVPLQTGMEIHLGRQTALRFSQT